MLDLKENIPVVFEKEICAEPIIAADSKFSGFFVYKDYLVGRIQESLSWKSFIYVAGFTVYSTSESFGIGLVRNNSSFYSITDLSYSDAFSLSDVDISNSYVAAADMNITNDSIIITIGTNYGKEVLVSSLEVQVHSLYMSSSVPFNHILNDSVVSVDDDVSGTQYYGSYGISVKSSSSIGTIVDSSDLDARYVLRKKVIGNHLDSIYDGYDGTFELDEITDVKSFHIDDVLYFAVLNKDGISILNMNNDTLYEVEFFDIPNDSSRSNIQFNSIQVVPLCAKKFIDRYYFINTNIGLFRRVRKPISIDVMIYNEDEGKSETYSIGVGVDESTGDNSFSILVTDSGEFIPNASLVSSREEYGLYYHSTKIMYNTDDVLLKFMDTILEHNPDQDTSITGSEIFSISNYIEYS